MLTILLSLLVVITTLALLASAKSYKKEMEEIYKEVEHNRKVKDEKENSKFYPREDK